MAGPQKGTAEHAEPAGTICSHFGQWSPQVTLGAEVSPAEEKERMTMTCDEPAGTPAAGPKHHKAEEGSVPEIVLCS